MKERILKKGFRRILSIIIMTAMVLTLVPSMSAEVKAATTKTITYDGTALSGVEEAKYATLGDTILLKNESTSDALYWLNGYYYGAPAPWNLTTSTSLPAGESVSADVPEGYFVKDVSLSGNRIAVALYKAITVSFEANGGSGTQATVTNVPGIYTVPTTTTFTPPEGKVFAGWKNKWGSWVGGATLKSDTDMVITAQWGDQAIVSFDANGGSGTQADEIAAKNGQYLVPTTTTFTPPEGKVFVGWSESVNGPNKSGTLITIYGSKKLYALWDDAPAPDPTPTPGKSEDKKETAKEAPVDLDTNKSEVAYGTVFVHNKDNVKDILDMKVHSVDARTKANQEFLAASFAKNQGKRARVLITTGIYPRNKLYAKDLGDKKFLSFVNLEKKVQPVYAVCYNQTDKAYYLTGTMNANGTAVFPDFIARDATNITIFVLE